MVTSRFTALAVTKEQRFTVSVQLGTHVCTGFEEVPEVVECHFIIIRASNGIQL